MSYLRTLLEVIRRASCDPVEEYFLRNATPECHLDHVFELFGCVEGQFIWQVLGKAEGPLRPGDDRQLDQGGSVLGEPSSNSMSSLMIRYRPTLILALWQFPFNTADDSLSGLLELSNRYHSHVLARGDDCALVADIHDVSSAEARRQRCKLAGVLCLG